MCVCTFDLLVINMLCLISEFVCVRWHSDTGLSAVGTAVKGGAWVMMAMHHCERVCVCVCDVWAAVCSYVTFLCVPLKPLGPPDVCAQAACARASSLTVCQKSFLIVVKRWQATVSLIYHSATTHPNTDPQVGYAWWQLPLTYHFTGLPDYAVMGKPV